MVSADDTELCGKLRPGAKSRNDLSWLSSATELTHGQLSVFMGSTKKVCSEAHRKQASMD